MTVAIKRERHRPGLTPQGTVLVFYRGQLQEYRFPKGNSQGEFTQRAFEEENGIERPTPDANGRVNGIVYSLLRRLIEDGILEYAHESEYPRDPHIYRRARAKNR